MSQVIPWDKLAELYYKNFPSRRGTPTKDARLVLGAVIIKHMLKLDDIGVIVFIQKKPYMHYFLGLKGFTRKPALVDHLCKELNISEKPRAYRKLARK